MKKVFLLFCVLLFTHFVNAQDIANSYTITGDIKGLKDSTVIMSIDNDLKPPRNDSAIVKDGKFMFTGNTTRPTNAFISLKNSQIGFSLFLETGHIIVKGNLNSSDEISIMGTPDNNDLTELNAKENAAYGEVRILDQRLKKGRNGNDTAAMKELERKIDEAANRANSKRTKMRVQFIREHPASLASGAAMYVVQDDIPWKELENLYHGVAGNVRNNSFCRGIADKIKAEKKVDIGRISPDFTLNDIAGHPIRFSSFRGKYVLLDFWASWCVPCREENKNVLHVFNEYKDKNFVILGISLDANMAKWKTAVIKDGLSWTNVCDTLTWGPGSVPQLYGVQPIPDNFLVDPQGKIIGRKLFGKELDKKLSEVLK